MAKNLSSGARNQAGINFQNRAGLSLFLQCYMSNNGAAGSGSFQGIGLEQAGQADFILDFGEYRVICEAKKHRVTYRHLRDILDTLEDVGEQDKILIVCTEVSEQFLNKVRKLQNALNIDQQILWFWLRQSLNLDKKTDRKWEETHRRLLDFFHDKGFEERHFELISQVRFLELEEQESEEVSKGLLSKIFGAWLPDDELDDMACSLAMRCVYQESAGGGFYGTEEFTRELGERKEKLIVKDDYKSGHRSAQEKAELLLDELENPESRVQQAANRLKALSADPPLFQLAITELGKRGGFDLKGWDRFWTAAFGSYFQDEVMRIFGEKIQGRESADYVIDFLERNISSLRFRLPRSYVLFLAAGTLLKAFEFSRQAGERVFELLKILYGYLLDSPLFAGDKSGSSDRSFQEKEIADGFCSLYRSGGHSLRENIIGYIYDSFDIVNMFDAPDLYPEEIHNTVTAHIEESPENFCGFIEAIKENYKRGYKKYGLRYEGWDSSGKGIQISQTTQNWGEADLREHEEVDFGDKRFVDKILIPYIGQLGLDEQWQLAERFLVTDAGQVNVDKPDFMNRAFIPFLLQRYASDIESDSQKAFGYLAAFIKMRRGIPWKADLIFFYAKNYKGLSAEKKWRLVELAFKEYNDVVNIFFEQMLWEQLGLGNQQAGGTLSKLIDQGDYLDKTATSYDRSISFLWGNIIGNDETFVPGFEYLKNFFGRNGVFNSLDSFRAQEFGKPIIQVISKDFDKGLALLKTLMEPDMPTKNQQLLLGGVLSTTPEEYTERIFTKALKPEFDKAESVSKLAEKFTETGVRQGFARFAKKFADAKKFREALDVAEFFIDDPSPTEQEDKDDENDGEETQFILTKGIRDGVFLSLLPFMSVDGRPYLNTVFELTQKLCRDKNSDVRRTGMAVLQSFVANRNAVMSDGGERFMSEKMAQKVEDLAFELLADQSNYRPKTLVSLGHVFNSMRMMDPHRMQEVVKVFFEHPVIEALDSIAQLMIFWAEFREDAFEGVGKNRNMTEPPVLYDPKPIQKFLKKNLEQGSPEVRDALVSTFMNLSEFAEETAFGKYFGIAMEYLQHAAKKYDPRIFRLLYRFCDKYMEQKFHQCYTLWKECLTIACTSLSDAECRKMAIDSNYLPFDDVYHEKIIFKILERLGQERFLEDLELLVGYPKEVNPANDDLFFRKIVAELERIDGYPEKVDAIYQKIVAVNYFFYPSYREWRPK